MLQGIPSLAATHLVPTCLCGVVECQGVFRVRSAESIRPYQTKVWLYERKALCWSGLQWKNFFVLESHNSVCPKVSHELDLSKARLLGGGRCGSFQSGLRKSWGSGPCYRATQLRICPDLSRAKPPRVQRVGTQEPIGWG
ncbi:hypothetical protein HJG60_012009 [Phyllostomus discolor]|uniref:Uncharacterized protein n=1 Tax=Phyllostomus discolor TaxID=89673 RepID=A0A834DWK8_9CHIR|nr:hypothetical protein HJG60_012009 [Phyllostomus discolor]